MHRKTREKNREKERKGYGEKEKLKENGKVTDLLHTKTLKFSGVHVQLGKAGYFCKSNVEVVVSSQSVALFSTVCVPLFISLYCLSGIYFFFLCLCLFLYLYLHACLSLCVYVSMSLSVSLSVFLCAFCLCMCLSVSASLSVFL